MPRAQVLVTVTAEALVDVPAGVEDVAEFCRARVELNWGDLVVDGLVQTPTVAVEHFIVPEPEPEPEPVVVPDPAPEVLPTQEEDSPPGPEPEVEPVPVPMGIEISPNDTLPLPVQPLEPVEHVDLVALFDDPAYQRVIRSAVAASAQRLLEDVVNQVVAELEPLLARHLAKNTGGTS